MRLNVFPFNILLLTLCVFNAVIDALMKGWDYCQTINDLLLRQTSALKAVRF